MEEYTQDCIWTVKQVLLRSAQAMQTPAQSYTPSQMKRFECYQRDVITLVVRVQCRVCGNTASALYCALLLQLKKLCVCVCVCVQKLCFYTETACLYTD